MLIYHLLHTDINMILMSLNTDSWFNTETSDLLLISDLLHTDININSEHWYMI